MWAHSPFGAPHDVIAIQPILAARIQPSVIAVIVVTVRAKKEAEKERLSGITQS